MISIKEMVVENRSYRSFDPTVRVSEDELYEMIDCARLSPSGINKQPLRYRVVTDEKEKSGINGATRLGGLLPDLKLPPAGHEPPAYIVICRDSEIAASDDKCAIDTGIAAEVILLTAVSIGLGGCLIGAFSREKIKAILALPDGIEPMLLVAIGKPDETSVITVANSKTETKYFRDSHNIHYVPKLPLGDVIIKK